MRTLHIRDLGRDADYEEVVAIQEHLLAGRVAGHGADTLLLLEHRPTFTLGRSGRLEHILWDDAELTRRGIVRSQTTRGGDVTYHGPGQLVGYPVIHLGEAGMKLLEYVTALEDVLIRALAASVCRALNIDSTAVLAQLPQTSAPHLRNDEAGINVPFRGGSSATGSILGDSFSRPYVLLGLVLLVGVVVLGVLTFFDHVPSLVTSRDEAIAPAPTVVASVLEARPASAALAASSVAAATSAASGVASAPGAIVEGSGLSTGTLVLRVRGPSWVEVVDATGVVQLRRVLQPGETVGVSGVAPLSVVVGRADLTEVQVYGKPFDLNPIARDNVARFEVKP